MTYLYKLFSGYMEWKLYISIFLCQNFVLKKYDFLDFSIGYSIHSCSWHCQYLFLWSFCKLQITEKKTTPSYHSAQNCVIFKIESPTISIFKLFYLKYKGAQAPPACAENMVFIVNNLNIPVQNHRKMPPTIIGRHSPTLLAAMRIHLYGFLRFGPYCFQIRFYFIQ